MRLLVTGGAGFIGSAVVRQAVARANEVLNLDKLTYAANLQSLKSVEGASNYTFLQADICNGTAVAEALEEFKPDVVMHLAAESHVDRSIDGPSTFIKTNILGTYQLLEAVLAYYNALQGEKKSAFRFHHVSTDEVFGALAQDDPPFTPETPYSPRSPYSASKAASDHLVMAWAYTYNLPVVLSNCSNNYGPFQFPEKLIPLMIINALHGKPLPVYGKGANVRDWLYVEDHADALLAVAQKGRLGEIYLIGGRAERTNIEVVNSVCNILDEIIGGRRHADLIEFVEDRPGHDLRYGVDSSIIETELAWAPSLSFEDGLRKTVGWYLENKDWWELLKEEEYAGKRLGLGNKGER